jgi:hypothetical protein
MRNVILVTTGIIIGMALAATGSALAGNPDSSGFAQQVPIFGQILNEGGKAIQAFSWNDLGSPCASGGLIKVRRTAERGAQSVQVITVAIECGGSTHIEELNGFIEGVNITIPPR